MSGTVLVVDDNDDNLRIINEILRTRGFSVRLARDGESALRALEQERPDVILLDVMMPEMDGLEVLDRIRANPTHASIPVILVTAKATGRGRPRRLQVRRRLLHHEAVHGAAAAARHRARARGRARRVSALAARDPAR